MSHSDCRVSVLEAELNLTNVLSEDSLSLLSDLTCLYGVPIELSIEHH